MACEICGEEFPVGTIYSHHVVVAKVPLGGVPALQEDLSASCPLPFEPNLQFWRGLPLL